MVNSDRASFNGTLTVYGYGSSPEGNNKNVSLRFQFKGTCTTAPFDINGSAVTNTSVLQGDTSTTRYQIVTGQCGVPASN
jgi:hypothetical protein